MVSRPGKREVLAWTKSGLNYNLLPFVFWEDVEIEDFLNIFLLSVLIENFDTSTFGKQNI